MDRTCRKTASYLNRIVVILLVSAISLFLILSASGAASEKKASLATSKARPPKVTATTTTGKRVVRLDNQLRAGPSPFSRTVDIELPEGEGKEIYERACVQCHVGQQMSRVNFGRHDWQEAVDAMIGWGAPMDEEEVPILVDYLAKHLNKEKAAPGVEIPGPAKATLENFELPTPHTLPHDTWFNGGLLWITEMAGQALASFDPKTKKFKEFQMRLSSDPKTLMADSKGNIWFAPDLANYIGKFDPKTTKVTEYYPPGPGIELHDIFIDKDDIVWFCVLKERPPLAPVGSKVGRLDPKTNEFKIFDTPTPGTSPYGIWQNSKGIIYYTNNQSHILGSIDPKTLKITEYPAPDKGTRMKRLTSTPDGVIWFTDYKRGYLMSFDPGTEKFREWASPSGPLSYPYGIGSVGDIVWYAEAQANPNMLVRFDTKTEKFQTFPVKQGGGIKHVHAAPDGTLWLSRPLNNGITRVTPGN
jgi:virginiamycin B lyase